MSFFKKLIKGIVVGAIVGFTGGLALGALGITAIGGTAITAAGLATWGAIQGGLQGAAMGLIKPPKMPTQDIQARANLSVDSQALGKWIFGETAAATDIVYSENIGGKQICQVVAAAAHEIDSYQAFYINDELVTFSGAAATGNYANALSIYRNLGTSTQSALSIPSSLWPSDARGLNVAHYALLWDFDTDNGKNKLSGGIPTRITQVVRGSKVYDPRKDSTRGGSGSHRTNDQSTWEFSSNWALIVAHYLLGYYSNSQLIYGVGVTADEIDWTQVAAMAVICDQTIDSKPRYRIGGILPMSQDHEYIIGQLEAAIGGKVSKVGGKYYIWCPHDDLVSAGTLTDADIVAGSGISFSPSATIENLYNTARGQFVDPALLYQLKPYPEVTESTAVTEDGKRRVMERDFTFIQDQSIAERVAREMVRRTRFTGTIRVVVGPRGLLIKPFDVINVNFRETNFTNELFRVVGMQYSAQGAVVLELLEEDASIYDTTTALGPSLVQNDPASYDPTTAYFVSGLTLTNVSIPGAGGTTVDAIKVAWNAPSAFVDFTEGGFRKSGDTDYIYDRAQRGATSGIIAPVQPGTLYEFRIRHISVTGVIGPYSTASITSGTTTSVGSAVIADLSITAAKIASSAVETAKIANAAVEAGKIAANAVTTDKINALAVTAAKVAANAIETAKIADLAVETGKLANAAATEAKIATNAITETKISDNAITTPKLVAGAVTAAKITAGTITANEIAASTITGAKIAAGTITAANIQALTITASEIAANAVTADKILANTITAAKIAAGTITATEIAASTITGAKIAAGTITASNIAALTITASEIAAGAIVSGKIAADAVSVNSLISNTSKTFDSSNFAFEMGTSTAIAGYQGAGIFRTQKNTSFAFGTISTASDSFALAGQSTNSAGAGYGGAFVNSTSSGGTTHRTEAYLTNSNQSGLFLHTSTGNQALLGNATYAGDFEGDVYVDGDITATGSITPFTGSHDGVLDNDIEPDLGDILVDVSVIAKGSVSDTLTEMALSSAVNQSAIGVYAGNRQPTYLPLSISVPGAPVVITPYTSIAGDRVLAPAYATLLDNARIIGCNSVGEGQINVCGENGDIAAGDLIVTSSIAGKGMKQADDIIRSRTVAKARESVTFASATDVKQIACIYLCG